LSLAYRAGDKPTMRLTSCSGAPAPCGFIRVARPPRWIMLIRSGWWRKTE